MDLFFLYVKQAFDAIFPILQPYLPLIFAAIGIILAWRIVAFSTRLLGVAFILIFCLWAFQTFFNPEPPTALTHLNQIEQRYDAST